MNATTPATPLKKFCFVIMPIGDQILVSGNVSSSDLKARYNDLIKDALLKARPGIEVIRADEVVIPGGVTGDILNRLMKADYVLADITYPNPNVFYELGIRHACHTGTILIRDANGPPLPFNISYLRHITYDNMASGLRSLAENLARQMDWIDNHPGYPDNQFLELCKSTRFQFPTYNRQVFPQVIESAIAEQLYIVNFYMERVIYSIDVTDVNDREVEFITEYSYLVTNRSNERHNYLMKYEYRNSTDAVLDVRFDGKTIDPGILEREYGPRGRAFQMLRPMDPNEKAEVYFKVKEHFRLQDSELYSSHIPAIDMKVKVCNPFANLHFDFGILYFENVLPIRTGNETEVYFDRGLLSYQGVRLNWKGV